MNGSTRPERKSRFSRPTVWVGAILLAIMAVTASCLFLDPVVSKWLQNHPNTWHENAWVDGFRQLGRAGVPICLVAFWSCLTNKWRPAFVVALAMILVGVSVCPLKALTRRARPSQILAVVPGQSLPEVPWQKKASFPSGDAAVAFAGAAALSLSWGRPWTLALFAAAGVIGVLRVTAFAHYPSDVMAGAIIGILCGVLAAWWAARWRPAGQFRVERKWRLAAAVVLIFVLPLIGPYLGMRSSLQIFLRLYGVPLAAVTLAWLAVVRWRARRSELKRMET
ncbi:MAG: phosphatase PAP2 family protein [Planctomycetes bacterium]|nr:phosphatase PAP2 family protein [Planctomycetota bacterium]